MVSKTRIHRLPHGENSVILRLLVLSQYQRVTDGHAAYRYVALYGRVRQK